MFMKCYKVTFALAVLLLLMASCRKQKMPPQPPLNLRTEYLKNPLGIDTPVPRFTWEVNDTIRGASQSAYRILVASSPDRLKNDQGDIWDSGTIQSDQSNLVEYGGPELKSGLEYFWKVMTYDEDGQPSDFSSPATFEMGLLKPWNWTAKWIGINETGKPPRSVMVRKDFTVKGEITKARIYVSGLGTYLLYINGKKVGDDLLEPGWTDYPVKVQYQVYDITQMLQKGKNTVGAILGNMWWSSGLGWQGNGGAVYSNGPLRFIAQLEIESERDTLKIISDQTWKGSHSPYLANTIYNGVTYDSRLEQKGWDEPGYNDSRWMPVSVINMNGVRMVAQQEPPVRIADLVTPIKITEPVPGNYVFDMGVNMVGYCQLKVNASAGTKITLRYSELLHPDGTVAQENLRSAKATDTYIANGSGAEVFEPYLTYHGFRYVQVSGLPEKPDKNTLTGLVFYSSAEPSGTFSCSKGILDSIQSNIVRGERSNLMSVPTDCPQRDERLGWMGDAQLFAPTACYNMNLARFFSKWERDIIDCQDKKEGYVYDVNPAIVVSGPAKPAWGDAVIVIPYEVYKFYGDKRIIEENYSGMKKWVEYMHSKSVNNVYTWSNEDSTWFGYGDWVAVKPSPSKPISQAYYYYSTKLLAQMAEVIGNEEDAGILSKRLTSIKAAYNRLYFRPDSVSYEGETQTANLVPVKFGLTDNDNDKAVMKTVAENVLDNHDHPTTGFIGTPLLLPLLCDYGYQDIAYKTAVQTSYPSWGYMVSQGATTMWELWNSDKEPPDQMNSRNHFALGSVGEWYYEYIAGIKPDIKDPGFKHSIIRPEPMGDLTHARGIINTPYGMLVSEWSTENADFQWHLKIPANTSAEIHIPVHGNKKIEESGKTIYRRGSLVRNHDYIRLLSVTDDEVIFEVKAGNYNFLVL